MRPALSAALIGALTAGAATFLVTAEPVADPGQVNLAVENAETTDPTLPGETGATGSVSGPAEEQDGESEAPAEPSGAPLPAAQSEPSSPQPPTKTREPSPAPPPSRPQVTEEEQVVALVNAARAESGCKPVRVVPELTAAAQAHSADMAKRNYFNHTTPEGVRFDQRIVEAGYPSPGAENLAQGQQSATQVMTAWMESDGHRANILNCQLTAIGVGLERDGWYWTQNFGY